MEIFYSCLGLAIGIITGLFIERYGLGKKKFEEQKEEKSRSEAERQELETRIREIEESRNNLIADLKVERSKSEQEQTSSLRQLEEMRRSTREQLDRARADKEDALLRQKQSSDEALAQQKKASAEAMELLQTRFDESIARLRAEVGTTTEKMLRQRQEEFEKSSTASMGNILQPLEKSLEEMTKRVSENTTRHAEFGGKLAESLAMVLEQSDRARASADKLANALRGGGKIQGDWGETVLTELLTSQGLTEGVQYETQFVLRDSSGNAIRGEGDRTMRPDVILHLDRERDVIIDAKVSLSAFMDYMNAETDELRERALRSHVQSIENHVKELAGKNYSAYIRPPRVSVGYVIMFVPNTAALYTAIDARKNLWRKAMEQGVYIADEQTLYAALRIIDITWRHITQAENHQEVYRLANEMLDRVQSFMTSFTKIGTEIDSARKAFDDGMKKLQSGGQSIPQTCSKLIKLGAKFSKTQKGVDPTLLGIE